MISVQIVDMGILYLINAKSLTWVKAKFLLTGILHSSRMHFISSDKWYAITHVNGYQMNASLKWWKYHQKYYILCTLVGIKIVDHSDIVGASPVGAART